MPSFLVSWPFVDDVYDSYHSIPSFNIDEIELGSFDSSVHISEETSIAAIAVP